MSRAGGTYTVHRPCPLACPHPHPHAGPRGGTPDERPCMSRTLPSFLRRPAGTAVRAAARLAARVAAGVAALGLVAGCAVPLPATGDAREAVVARWGPPTGRYTLPAGAERLEYATGPFGRMTWMVDLDAGGRVSAVTQVLNEARFAEFQRRSQGMPRDELLRELGRPGEVQRLGWMGGQVWSWRYPTNDCLWFQVTLDRDGKVDGSGYGIDPVCDAPSDRE